MKIRHLQKKPDVANLKSRSLKVNSEKINNSQGAFDTKLLCEIVS